MDELSRVVEVIQVPGSVVVDIHDDSNYMASEREAVAERSPLLPKVNSQSSVVLSSYEAGPVNGLQQPENVAGIICLLLIGVFIANADGSIVLATNGTISSSFSQLEYASWLTTGYVLAMCAAQPVVGKLSDIFGRKLVLLICYAVFGVGTIISGTGLQLWQVIAGRAVAGLGGSGMVVIVSILITDLVPKIEVAAWRSYVNVVATIGRSLGGPIGGWLADTVGWRWSFIGQVPFVALAFLLVLLGLKNPTSISESKSFPDPSIKTPSRLGRIDFVGAVLISSAIISFLLAVDLPGQGTALTSPVVIALTTMSLILGTIFLLYEGKYAREPIFPPRLLRLRDVATSYSIAGLQTAAQMALMFSVPLYFRVTEGASNTRAGSHLVPAVVGNTTGGLLTGYLIKRTGRYKYLTTVATICAAASYGTLMLRWRGNIGIIESLEIFPGGLGTGIAGASTFIALTSNMGHDDIAAATSGIYLASSIGMILGVSISSGLQRWVLQDLLVERLSAAPDGREIISHVLSDVSYIRRLSGRLRGVVVKSYIESLEYSHGFSLICSTMAFLTSLCIKEHSLID